MTADRELDAAARYDPKSKQLTINPGYSDSEAFAAIAAEEAAPGKESCYYPISVEEYTYGPLDELRIDKVYQGTGSSTLAKGARHFTDTSIWDGNVCVAGHNRGVNAHFGKIHTLEPGDTITRTTKLGTRTYAVTSVEKVSETDTRGTAEEKNHDRIGGQRPAHCQHPRCPSCPDPHGGLLL